nr:hypothetical protein [Tanacetum cinerariifolium]
MKSLNANLQERATSVAINKKSKQRKVAWHLFNYFIHFSRMNERQMQSKEVKVDSDRELDADLVVTESSRTESENHDTSSKSKNHTHAEDANINPANEKEPMAERLLGSFFQPMFDEYFNPPTTTVILVPVAAAPRAVDLADSPVSTSIDQDALSASIPSTQEQEHSPNISQGFEESPKAPTIRDDPFHESLHEDSTS